METFDPTLLACRLNPPLLMEAIGMVPDAWQANLLRSRSRRILVLSTRQAGKSQTCAIVGLQTILTHPGSLVVMVSESLRQSKELFEKLIIAYRALGRPVRKERETRTELRLRNGSRCICLPGAPNTIRCYSKAHTIIADEAAMMQDALFTAISPMLSVSGGRLILISTPKGQRGYFFAEYDSGNTVWERYKITADDCLRINREHLAAEKRAMGHAEFMQEYYCVFTQAEDQYFETDAINRAFVTEPNPYFTTAL
jgi:hypothetical protein